MPVRRCPKCNEPGRLPDDSSQEAIVYGNSWFTNPASFYAVVPLGIGLRLFSHASSTLSQM